MNSLMLNKSGVLAKQFSTFTTLIRAFSCVNYPVLSETGIVSKGFPTFAALIRPLSSVDSLVLDK